MRLYTVIALAGALLFSACQSSFASRVLDRGAAPPDIGGAEAGAGQPPTVGDLSGLGFGLAIGFAQDNQTNIVSTAVQNNVLRLTGGDKSDLGFWLEVHHFWGLDHGTPATDPDTKQSTTAHAIGIGPFVAVQAGTDTKIIQSLGVGLMVGFRTGQTDKSAINIGIGYAAQQINVLTTGITLDQPLPTGVASATTRTKIVGAPLLITSFSF